MDLSQNYLEYPNLTWLLSVTYRPTFRQEIARKDELIRKHYEKIESWKNLLSDQQNYNKPMQAHPVPPEMRSMAGGAPGPGGMMPGGMGMPMQVPSPTVAQWNQSSDWLEDYLCPRVTPGSAGC